MVFLSAAPLLQRFTAKPCREVPFYAHRILHAEKDKPDQYWTRRKYLMMSQDMLRRKRNCRRAAKVHSMLRLAREHDLWSKRIIQKSVSTKDKNKPQFAIIHAIN